jgi:predicted metal-dependent peptidase
MARMKKRTAAQRISRAVSALLVFAPFYGTLLLNLEMVEDRSISTAAVDGKRMFYNPEWIDSLADDELLFVLCHEVSHLTYLHHTRRQQRDPKEWNIAADYVINLDLVQAGIGRMPAKGLYDTTYIGMAVEDVFASRHQQQAQSQQQQQQQQEQGEPGEGEGQGGGQDGNEPDDGSQQQGEGGGDGDGEGDEASGATSEPSGGSGKGKPSPGMSAGEDVGGCGQVLDAAQSEGEIAEQEAEWQTITRQAIAVATRHAGKLPSHLERLVGELNKPKQNWRELLRRFADPCNRQDYSWQRPDRRFGGAGFILPGTVTDGVNHIVVAVDTSGSIDDEALTLFRTEVQSILDEGAVDKVTVVHCDAAINGVAEFESGDLVKMVPMGGGGTSYRPVWHWLKDNQDDIAALVYFTDLEPNDGFGDEPIMPVMWAAYGDPRWLRQKRVPFGDVIEVHD